MIVKRRSRGIGPGNGKTALIGLLMALTIGSTIPSAGGLSDDLRVAYRSHPPKSSLQPKKT